MTRYFAPLSAFLAVGLFLSGCVFTNVLEEARAVLNEGGERAAELGAVFVDTTCGRSIPARQDFADAINAKADGQVTAFDCDGDGEPDF